MLNETIDFECEPLNDRKQLDIIQMTFINETVSIYQFDTWMYPGFTCIHTIIIQSI